MQKQAGPRQHSSRDNFLLYSHKKASWQLSCLGLLKLSRNTDTYMKQPKSYQRLYNTLININLQLLQKTFQSLAKF